MKNELFKTELEYIENEKVRNFTKFALDNLPDYFFTVAASSTGKYHPSYALGDGGLVRHTKAAARFAKHMLSVEQNKAKFNELERSCILCGIILHDGWKHGEGKSSFTVHEHPQVCADWVLTNNNFDDLLNKEERELISSAIASHMGEWNTTKRSKVVLHKPTTEIQEFVHICDYLASRKDIEVLFNETEQKSEVKLEEYKFPFGKHKGQLITDVAKNHMDYLQWMKGNMRNLQEPLKSFLDELVK